MGKPVLSLKARALRYLSMREHSRYELTRKLAPHAESSEQLEDVLNFLEKHQYLSAERFSESLVHRKQARFGNQRILAELKQHQLPDDVVQDVKAGLLASEMQRACEVLQRKFPHVAADQQERAKQMRFLLQRGFSSEVVRAALRESGLQTPLDEV